MEKLADGTGALETWPHEAILEIHSLADWFDGDEYIHHLLVAMCFDLAPRCCTPADQRCRT
jgi:hypothetical protein